MFVFVYAFTVLCIIYVQFYFYCMKVSSICAILCAIVKWPVPENENVQRCVMCEV